ncbi:MAG TPA: hypothetical protein VL086_04375 [Candidatus Nitrosotalea sp.]|nr:hypothetical protein [Candidatus Nitrosotalea sp.]
MKLIGMLLSLICVVPVHAMDLPAPPGGFSWREVPEIKAAFLVPSGWQFRRQTQGSTLAIFITPEGFDKDGQFSTGLTINVLRNAKPGTTVEYAHGFIARLAADKRTGEVWARQFGPMKAYGCRFKTQTGVGTSIVHTLMVANPKTGTLYLFGFEAPVAGWTDAWTKGEKIMESLAVDDEV